MLTPDERGQAGQVMKAHRAAVERIRSDVTLSREGRRRAIARETITARNTLAQLRSASDTRSAQQRRELEFKLFGLGTRTSGADVISHRDAADRAAECKTPAEARRLLSRAETTGDQQLARAVFAEAWARHSDMEPGWGELGRAYLERRPDDNAAAAELAALIDGNTADRLSDRLYTQVPMPSEIAGAQLEVLAAYAPGET